MLNHQETPISLRINNQETSLCLSLPSFWLPDFITLSAWIKHAPFAFWLVNATRPGTFVELGTHHGFSYFSFCQAVQQLRLSTRCYAIDTWKGDVHSGFYGEEVFQKVNAHNNQNYSGFSQLMRSTFDEALEYFLDKSIDVLHIDGRHFYEDIKHDFVTWLPKLSDRAVVLFHDTTVKERHFGVFKLWDELRQLYPHFEFIHGHGLGVLGIGNAIPPQLRTLFDAANNDEQTAGIRYIYSHLGSALADRYQLTTQSEQMTQLVMEEEKLRTDFITLKEKLGQSESNLLALSDENKQQQIDMISLKNQLAVLQTIIKKEDEKEKMRVKLEIKDRETQQLKNQLSVTETALKHREGVIEHLGRIVMQIRSSRTWRWTLPLRKLRKIFSSSS